MVAALLDTSILVDLLRNHLAAHQWIRSQTVQFGITPIVWLEVLEGAPNKVEQTRSRKLLKTFERVEIISSDFDWAIEKLTQFHLSHNVAFEDCLIAAPAHRLQLPLYTQNIKHFQPILGSLAQKPY